jgi:hypothetical protein
MPLHIRVKYEASWRNSFLDGSNDEPLPKGGRNFVGSMTTLKNEGNFIQREVRQNTVMGILCRLIGDQRKLYQARKDKNYYFADLEDKIFFQDLASEQIKNSEVVYIRNMSGSTDQNSFTGMINANDKAFTSDFSKELWGVLFLELDDLFEFILNKEMKILTQDKFDPLIVADQLEKLDKMKAINVVDSVEIVLQKLKEKFSSGQDPVSYTLDAKERIKPIVFYTSALYIQVERLQKENNLSEIFSKRGGLSGISKRGFTKKDFMDRYTTGKKKIIFGNPYLLKEKIKGQGEVTSLLTKSSGVLDITIDVTKDRADELQKMIEFAGVSSFYLGKKGLAYVEEIHFEATA